MSKRLGLLGGVAAGKSAVARAMEARGLLRLDADAVAREVVAEPRVLAALSERFGPGILAPDGSLDRAALAASAFGSEADTAALNALVHPEVRRRLREQVAAAGERPLVLDVPLLLGSPLEDLVDTWIFVSSPEAAREERAAGRGWELGERARREARQADLAAKRARADHVLENHGTIEDLERSVDTLLQALGLLVPPPER